MNNPKSDMREIVVPVLEDIIAKMSTHLIYAISAPYRYDQEKPYDDIRLSLIYLVMDIIVHCKYPAEEADIYFKMFTLENETDFLAYFNELCKNGQLEGLNFSWIHLAGCILPSCLQGDLRVFFDMRTHIESAGKKVDDFVPLGFNKQGCDYSTFYRERDCYIDTRIDHVDYSNPANAYLFYLFNIVAKISRNGPENVLQLYLGNMSQQMTMPMPNSLFFFLLALSWRDCDLNKWARYFQTHTPIINKFSTLFSFICVLRMRHTETKLLMIANNREIANNSKEADIFDINEHAKVLKGDDLKRVLAENNVLLFCKTVAAGNPEFSFLVEALDIYVKFKKFSEVDDVRPKEIALRLVEHITASMMKRNVYQNDVNQLFKAVDVYKAIILSNLASNTFTKYKNERSIISKIYFLFSNFVELRKANIAISNLDLDYELNQRSLSSSLFSGVTSLIQYQGLVNGFSYLAQLNFDMLNMQSHMVPGVKLTKELSDSYGPELKLLSMATNKSYDKIIESGNTAMIEKIVKQFSDLLKQVKLRSAKNKPANDCSGVLLIHVEMMAYLDRKLLQMKQKLPRYAPLVIETPKVKDVFQDLLEEIFPIPQFTHQVSVDSYEISFEKQDINYVETFKQIFFAERSAKQYANCFVVTPTEAGMTMTFNRPKQIGALKTLLENGKLRRHFEDRIHSEMVGKSLYEDNVPILQTTVFFTEDDKQTLLNKLQKIRFGADIDVALNDTKAMAIFSLEFKGLSDDAMPIILVDKHKTCLLSRDLFQEYKDRIMKQFKARFVSYENGKMIFEMKSDVIADLYQLEIKQKLKIPFKQSLNRSMANSHEAAKAEKPAVSLQVETVSSEVKSPVEVEKSPLDKLKFVITTLVPLLHSHCGWIHFDPHQPTSRRARRYIFNLSQDEKTLSMGEYWIKSPELIQCLISQCDASKISYHPDTNKLTFDKSYLHRLSIQVDELKILAEKLLPKLFEKADIKYSPDKVNPEPLPTKTSEPQHYQRNASAGLFFLQPKEYICFDPETRLQLIVMGDIIKRADRKEPPHQQEYPIMHYALLFNLIRFFERAKSFADEKTQGLFNAWRNRLMHEPLSFSILQITNMSKQLITLVEHRKLTSQFIDTVLNAVEKIFNSISQKLASLEHKIQQLSTGLDLFYQQDFVYDCEKDIEFYPDWIDAKSMYITIIGEAFQFLNITFNQRELAHVLKPFSTHLDFIQYCKPKRDEIGHDVGIIDSSRFAVIESVSMQDLRKWLGLDPESLSATRLDIA